MQVKELIALLQDMDPELEVYSCCDHGQTPERIFAPQVAWTESLTYHLWNGYCVGEDADEEGFEAKFVIL